MREARNCKGLGLGLEFSGQIAGVSFEPYFGVMKKSRMDPSQLKLRSGLGHAEESETDARAKDAFLATSMGLLQVFTEEATKTAGMYAIACRRNTVTERDIADALKYQALNFFRADRLEERVNEATESFWAKMAEYEEKGAPVDDASERTETEDEVSSASSSDGGVLDDAEVARWQSLKQEVESIVKGWSDFEPEDQIQKFIKSAIDAADARSREEEEANN